MYERHVRLTIYNKNFKTDTENQAADYIQIDPRNALPPIEDTRTHGMDQKATPLASQITELSSKILSAIDPSEYLAVLGNFCQSLLNNIDLSFEHLNKIESVLDALGNTCM
jgi:hypothetical protein